MKTVQQLPKAVAKGAPAEVVDCLVQEVGYRGLRNWQTMIHDAHILPDFSRLDRKWNWPRFLATSYLLSESVGRLTYAFQVIVEGGNGQGVPVGVALLVLGYPHPGSSGSSSAFVWYLSSAPVAALLAHGIGYKLVVMPLLLDTAIQVSRQYGYRGRVSLHADSRGTQAQQSDLERRYTRAGMKGVPHLIGRRLSVFRPMDAHFFVHSISSATIALQRWNHLR